MINLLVPKSHKIKYSDSQGTSKKKSLSWKPTTVEAREGIIVRVNVPGDLDHVVEEKRTKMSKMGIRLQPFVIACGQDILQLDRFYVCIDNVSYEASSLLEAIHILFQFVIRFNVGYPVESENFCYFIQWGLYCIKSDWDTEIPAVYTELKKLKNFKSKQNKCT